MTLYISYCVAGADNNFHVTHPTRSCLFHCGSLQTLPAVNYYHQGIDWILTREKLLETGDRCIPPFRKDEHRS